MNRLFAAFVGALLCCAASASDEPINVAGFADMSCGAWAKSRPDSAARAQYLAWIRGFITGVNYASPKRQIALVRLPSDETTELYVDKYCRENPLSEFPGAAFRLVEELRH
jgi:hypothetical protein